MDQLTTTISPLVIDLALVVFILLVAALRAKAGLYHCVMSVVIIILALAIALVGSKLLLPTVKDYAWSKYSVEVATRFDDEVRMAQEQGDSFGDIFRDSWNNMISGFGENEVTKMLTLKDSDMDYSDSGLVAKLRAYTLLKAELVTEKVCHMGLFGLITAIALFVLTIIKNIIGEVADFSAIGWLNHGGGFVLGAIEAIVILILIVRGAGLLSITFFSDLAEGTVLLKWLIGGDIQSTIVTLQNLTIDDLRNIKLEDLTTVDFNDVGSQVKELVNNIDLTKAPEEVKDVLDNIDVNQITEDTKEIIDTIKDTKIETPEIVNDVKDVINNVTGN